MMDLFYVLSFPGKEARRCSRRILGFSLVVAAKMQNNDTTLGTKEDRFTFSPSLTRHDVMLASHSEANSENADVLCDARTSVLCSYLVKFNFLASNTNLTCDRNL